MKTVTLVIGASLNTVRYSNRAIKNLRAKNIVVNALGVKEGMIDDVKITTEKKLFNNIDTVSLYINSTIQKEYYKYVLEINPRRVIFNPGTENDEFEKLLNKKGIQTENACTLVLLATNQY